MKTVSDNVILPAAEMEVMNGIWLAYEETNRPVTTREVLECSPELKRWKTVTILTFIGRLYGRGFIQIEKQNPEVGRGNLYTPLVDHSSYRKEAYRDFVEKTMGGDRLELARLIVADMTPDEMDAAKEKYLRT